MSQLARHSLPFSVPLTCACDSLRNSLKVNELFPQICFYLYPQICLLFVFLDLFHILFDDILPPSVKVTDTWRFAKMAVLFCLFQTCYFSLKFSKSDDNQDFESWRVIYKRLVLFVYLALFVYLVLFVNLAHVSIFTEYDNHQDLRAI